MTISFSGNVISNNTNTPIKKIESNGAYTADETKALSVAKFLHTAQAGDIFSFENAKKPDGGDEKLLVLSNNEATAEVDVIRFSATKNGSIMAGSSVIDLDTKGSFRKTSTLDVII